MNMGGSRDKEELREFLTNMFNDINIINIKNDRYRSMIADFIVKRRLDKAWSGYKTIGGASPLHHITDSLVGKLSIKLKDYKVVSVMRYTQPNTQQCVDELKRNNIKSVVLLPLYAQYSTTTTKSSLDEFIALAKNKLIGFVIVNGLYVLAYALTHGKADNYWFDIGITGSHMIGKDGSDKSVAKSGAVVISTGIIQNKTKLHKDTKSGFGFIGEIGHMYISFDDNTTNDEKLQGSYAMIGPTFRFYFDKRVSFHIDMMAGKSQDENIGTIGAFRVGVKAPMTRNTFFDIIYGASYIEFDDSESELFDKNTKRDNIYQTFGLAFGYSF